MMGLLSKRIAAIIFGLGGVLAGCSDDTNQSTFSDCPDCPSMINIPAGTFAMGFDGGEDGRPEGPVRQISVPAFAMGVYEITQAQFAYFVSQTGYQPKGGCRVWPDEKMADGAVYSWQDPGYGKTPLPDQPVACVSWYDAVAYANWLAEVTGKPYRLPSEAEWEYATRAGSTSDYYWGDDPEDGCDHANMNDASGAQNGFRWAQAACDDGHRMAAPVGSYQPNAFGLYDMLGNVWEWLADCYVLDYAGVPVDGSAYTPSETCDRRSVRGGSWITRPDRHRVSFRGRDPEDTLYFMFGFRVALDLDEEPK